MRRFDSHADQDFGRRRTPQQEADTAASERMYTYRVYDDSGMKIFISKIPFLGGWLADKLYHITFYKRDTASIFMTYAQQSVLKVIEDITKNKGVRGLSEGQKKPNR